MSRADLGDVWERAESDSDIRAFIRALKQVLSSHGAWITTRIFAAVLAPYKRDRFEKKLQVRESRTARFMGIPSDLAGVQDINLTYKQDEVFRKIHRGLDHKTLWQHSGKLRYLTSEPYHVSKDELRYLIEYCDMFGIDFQIDAESCYYPGHTIRILFKKGSITPYDAMKHLEGERI